MGRSFKDESINNADSLFQETLGLLDWPKLCKHLSTFASTSHGEKSCLELTFPEDCNKSKNKLAETIEISTLDKEINGGISFEGVHDLKDIILHCSKGGVVTGEHLLKVSQTLRSARRLRKVIADSSLRPALTTLLADIKTLPELVRTLEFGIEEGGRIADRASDELSNLRKQLQNLRLQRKDQLQQIIRTHSNLLQDNVIGDRNGRAVLSLKASSIDKLPGMIHDRSSSGNTFFCEPQVIISVGNQISQLEVKIISEENRLLLIWSALVGDYYLKVHIKIQIKIHCLRSMSMCLKLKFLQIVNLLEKK